MKTWTAAVVGALLIVMMGSVPATALDAPSNDAIGSATVIGVLPFVDTLDTSIATTDPDDPWCSGSGHTVWYSYTPLSDMNIVANTFGSSYDTTLSVYTGVPGSLTQVACNDDFGGTQSRITFLASGGTTYSFMVGAFGNGPGGSLSFGVDGSPPSVNDAIADATAITSLPFSETGDSTYATSSPDDPDCYGNAASVWYSFTAPESMVLDVFIDYPTTIPTTLSTYTGTAGSLVQLSCNNAYDVAYNETYLSLAAGQTIYLMVGSYSGSGGLYTIGAELLPPPANDEIGSSREIANLPYSDVLRTAAATTAPTDPDCAGNGHTVWYSLKLPGDTIVEIDTLNSSYDTTLSVYIRTKKGALTQVACSDDDFRTWSRVRFRAQRGVNYLVMVGAKDGGGRLNLNASEPFDIGLAFSEGSVDAKTGIATVTGVVTCNEDAWIDHVDGVVRQRIGRTLLEAGFWVDGFQCTAPETAWTSVPTSAVNGLFVAGGATLHGAYTWGCSSSTGECDDESVTGPVSIRLRGR